MPIYEYRCQDCNHEFERMQKFSDPPIGACPTCSGSVQKLISRSAFHLKGSGWYVTDYGRNGGEKSESSESEKSTTESTTGDKSTSEKSDGKAATASAPSGSSSESAKKKSSGTTAAA
jgi:putative FmdB family regulatory protein